MRVEEEVETPTEMGFEINDRYVNSRKIPKGMESYCEFHIESGHKIQECAEFKVLLQSLTNNKELEFFEEFKGPEGILGI